MRIKLSTSSLKNINIQNIHILCMDGLPSLYFDCDKKYEYVIQNEKTIFHDKNNKEYFRSTNVRLDYRYYECDTSTKHNKIRFMVTDILFEDIGCVSAYYLNKILLEACNAKHATKRTNDKYQILKNKWTIERSLSFRLRQKARAMQNRCKFYIKSIKEKRHITTRIATHLIIYSLESKAPT